MLLGTKNIMSTWFYIWFWITHHAVLLLSFLRMSKEKRESKAFGNKVCPHHSEQLPRKESHSTSWPEAMPRENCLCCVQGQSPILRSLHFQTKPEQYFRRKNRTRRLSTIGSCPWSLCLRRKGGQALLDRHAPHLHIHPTLAIHAIYWCKTKESLGAAKKWAEECTRTVW